MLFGHLECGRGGVNGSDGFTFRHHQAATQKKGQLNKAVLHSFEWGG
jgi:hypothetical protein